MRCQGPFPGELAEAAQTDEFLQRKHTYEFGSEPADPMSAQNSAARGMLPPTAVPFTLKIVAITASVY